LKDLDLVPRDFDPKLDPLPGPRLVVLTVRPRASWPAKLTRLAIWWLEGFGLGVLAYLFFLLGLKGLHGAEALGRWLFYRWHWNGGV